MEILGLVDIPLSILLAVLCLSLLYIYGSYPMKTWSRLGVSGPPALPFIGNIHQFLSSKTGMRASVTEWEKLYGKFFGIQFFRKPCLIVTDVEILNEIMVKDFNSFHDRFTVGDCAFIPKTIMDGLALQCGDNWKRIRRIMTPTFTASKLKLLTGYMNITARQLANKLQDHANAGTQAIAKDVFAAFSLDVIAGTAFGLDLDSQNKRDGGLFQRVENIFKTKTSFKLALAVTGVFPFSGYLFQKMNVSTFEPEGVQFFKDYFGKLVVERKNERQKFKQSDFFQLLLDAEMEEPESGKKEKLTVDEVVSQGVIFIMAGYETTSSTLQFVMHLLANNHQVQDRLVEEIRSVVTDPENEVSYDVCQKLKYTEAVLNETLRMYPPIHHVKREATRDTVLNGIPIAKGTGVLIPIYNIGRDPELFDDPDTFNPDRFMDDDFVRPVSFLPFGFGPRQCIGMRLSMMEMKIAMVHIFRKIYIVDVEPKQMVLDDYTGFLTPRQPFKITIKHSKNI